MSYDLRARKLDLGTLTFVAGPNTLVIGGQLGAGLGSIKVVQTEFQTSAAVTITPYSNTTKIPGAYALTGAGASVLQQNTGQAWQEALPGQSLIWNFSGPATLTGAIWYVLA